MGLRTILTGVSVSLCVLTTANAADIKGGSLKDTPFVAAAWNWEGLYGGWVAGYGSGEFEKLGLRKRQRRARLGKQ